MLLLLNTCVNNQSLLQCEVLTKKKQTNKNKKQKTKTARDWCSSRVLWAKIAPCIAPTTFELSGARGVMLFDIVSSKVSAESDSYDFFSFFF